jgi:hypothetical protein
VQKVLLNLSPSLPTCFVCDMHVEKNKCTIIELNPFYHKTGACLFDWDVDKDLLLSGDCVIRLASLAQATQRAQKEFQGLKGEIDAAFKNLPQQQKCLLC